MEHGGERTFKLNGNQLLVGADVVDVNALTLAAEAGFRLKPCACRRIGRFADDTARHADGRASAASFDIVTISGESGEEITP